MSVKAFDGVFEMPVQGRTMKPRKNGVTMPVSYTHLTLPTIYSV